MSIIQPASEEENQTQMDEKKNGAPRRHVGLVLRARRREMNLSQASLAKRMQISQEVISNYENGVTPVRADDLPRFARILEVTPLYFFEPAPQNVEINPQILEPGAQNLEPQNETAAQDQGAAAQDQPYKVQSGGVKLSAVAGIDSSAAKREADYSPTSDRILSPDQSITFNRSLTPDRVLAPDPSVTSAPLVTSDFPPKWTVTGQSGIEAAEASEKDYEGAKYEGAKYDARSLKALSEADLETAMLAFYRTLGRRMQTMAVRLIRELAWEEREAKSPGETEAKSPDERQAPRPVVVEKAKPRSVVKGVSQSKENAQREPSKK